MTRLILPILLLIHTTNECLSQERGSLSSRDRVITQLTKPFDLELSSASLADLATAIRSKRDIDVFIDAEALKEEGIDQGSIKLSIPRTSISLRAALLKLLEPLEITFAVQFESIVITTQHRAVEYWRPVVYDVTDLLKVEHATQSADASGFHESSLVDFDGLINLIVMTIRPDTWSAGTGPSHDCMGITLRGKHLLVIVQSEHGHMDIETLLRDIRMAGSLEMHTEQSDEQQVAEY